MHIEIERIAVNIVLADQPGLIGLVNGRLQAFAFANKLAANINIGGVGAHGEGGEQRPFNEMMRIVTYDLAVLAGARLGFVGVDDHIGRASIGLAGHERPFEASGKTGAAATAQAGRLDLVNNPVFALFQQLFGAVPGTTRLCALQAAVAQSVQIGENAIFIGKHQAPPLPSFA